MRKIATVRHAFDFSYYDEKGKRQQKRVWTKVRYATSEVEILLKPEHVRRAIELGGVGRTDNCSGSVCVVNHASSFPHSVFPYADWQYSRVWIVSKLGPDKFPVESVVYEHRESFARLNDSLTGQRQLLAQLEKNGPRVIRLMSARQRSRKGRNGSSRKRTGARSYLKGAKLRHAFAKSKGAA